MCECLDYEDGDRFQCVVCADMTRAIIEAGATLRYEAGVLHAEERCDGCDLCRALLAWDVAAGRGRR